MTLDERESVVLPGEVPDDCTCGRVTIGVTGSPVGYNWSHACPVHGHHSAWYTVEGGRELLQASADRAVRWQARARLARNLRDHWCPCDWGCHVNDLPCSLGCIQHHYKAEEVMEGTKYREVLAG